MAALRPVPRLPPPATWLPLTTRASSRWPSSPPFRALCSVRGLSSKPRAMRCGLDGVEGRVAVGAPGDELVAFGDEVDLLVVGSRGRGPLRRLILGSTSLHLTREARCPLLIIPRPAGAEQVSGAG
jgi:hypothetical protein